MKRLLAGLVAALAFAGVAKANDLDTCTRIADADKSIGACTRIIAAAQGDPGMLVVAYANRGAAYGNKGDYDREIADEDKAIALNPRLAMLYVNRGSGYGNKGDYDSE